MQCSAVRFDAMRCDGPQRSALLCCPALSSALPCPTMLCYALFPPPLPSPPLLCPAPLRAALPRRARRLDTPGRLARHCSPESLRRCSVSQDGVCSSMLLSSEPEATKLHSTRHLPPAAASTTLAKRGPLIRASRRPFTKKRSFGTSGPTTARTRREIATRREQSVPLST